MSREEKELGVISLPTALHNDTSSNDCLGKVSKRALFSQQDIMFAVNNIVDNRHSIAHGVDVGMTFGRIKDYYEKSLKQLKIIEKQCVG